MEYINQKSWSYRMAARLFDSAFEELDRVPEAERQLLMREISTRLRRRVPKSDVAAESPTVIGVSMKLE
jgi:hypothetical protein